MLRELCDIAKDADLERVNAELVSGIQEDAIQATEQLGFIRAATIHELLRDRRRPAARPRGDDAATGQVVRVVAVLGDATAKRRLLAFSRSARASWNPSSRRGRSPLLALRVTLENSATSFSTTCFAVGSADECTPSI